MNHVLLLMFAIGVVGSNSLVLSPISIDVASSFYGSSATDVMIASAAYGAGTALSALSLAPKADRMGLRRALVCALFGLTLSLGMSAAATSVNMLIIAQAMAGIAAGLALPAIYGLSAEIAPLGKESETLGKVLTGWTLSLVAGVSLSAVLSDIYHWRAVYAVMTLSGLALAISLHRAQIGQKTSNGEVTSPLNALRIPGLVPVLVAVIAFMIAFYGLYAYLGTHLTIDLGLTTAVAGLTALFYGIGFAAVVPLDRLIDRYGTARAAPIAFAGLFAVYVALAAFTDSAYMVLAICVLWGAANHLGLNILVGQLTAISPSQRGAILGLYSAVTYAAMFAGTALFGPVYENFGFKTAAALSAACIIPAILKSRAFQSNTV